MPLFHGNNFALLNGDSPVPLVRFGEVWPFHSGSTREIGAGLGIAKHVVWLIDPDGFATGDRILEGLLAFEVSGCVHQLGCVGGVGFGGKTS